jgi:hypothetical protein
LSRLARPERSEYAEYYGRYIDRVPDGPILDTLARQLEESLRLLAGLSEALALFRYAPGKWSVKEVVGHVIDVERVFACRALHFARGERQHLPGIEQDEYVAAAGFDARPLPDLVTEFETLRRSNLVFFAGLDEQACLRRGTASGYEFTVRAFPWIVAGHERHHLSVLRERYLTSAR